MKYNEKITILIALRERHHKLLQDWMQAYQFNKPSLQFWADRIMLVNDARNSTHDIRTVDRD